MQYEFRLGRTIVPEIMQAIPDPRVHANCHLSCLVLLSPCELNPLTPLDEVGRWQLVGLAQSMAVATGADRRKVLSPAETYKFRGGMRCFQVRDAYCVSCAKPAKPRFTDNRGHKQALFLLRSGSDVGAGAAPFLMKAPTQSTSNELVSLADIFTEWGIAGEPDGTRIACLTTLQELGTLAAAKRLRHLLLPVCMSHHVRLPCGDGPVPFPLGQRLEVLKNKLGRVIDTPDASGVDDMSLASMQARLEQLREYTVILLSHGQVERGPLESFCVWLESLMHNKLSQWRLTEFSRGRHGFMASIREQQGTATRTSKLVT